MEQQLKALLVGYLANAKQELDDEGFDKLQNGLLEKYIGLVAEAVPVVELADKALIKHAIHALNEDYTVEEVILHIFLLHMFKLAYHGSNHPLERGIIKQKIDGIIPIFKRAFDNQSIRQELFEKNVDALLHIAENTVDQLEILEALKQEYERFQS